MSGQRPSAGKRTGRERASYKPKVTQLESRHLMSASWGDAVLGGDLLDRDLFSAAALFGPTLGTAPGGPNAASGGGSGSASGASLGQTAPAQYYTYTAPLPSIGQESVGIVADAPGRLAPGAGGLLPHAVASTAFSAGRGSLHTPVITPKVGDAGNGRLGPLITTFGLGLGTALIPVNADDDNGSTVTNGVPAIRDFAATNMTAADPDLKLATITLPNTIPQNGTFNLSTTNLFTGRVSFWQDAKKAKAMPASWTNGDGTPLSFYIEGDANSSVANDITITLTYTYTDAGGQHVLSAQQSVTVTPVVNAFGAYPNSGQNVFFKNGADLDDGLVTLSPNNIAGVTLQADVQIDNLRGSPNFVQNLTGIANGPDGAPPGAPLPGGWYNGGQVWLLEPAQGYSLPILDNAPGQQVYGAPPILSIAGNIERVTCVDSPTLTPPVGVTYSDQADVQLSFRLYAVWTWQQMNTTVLYTLGYTNWQVLYYATHASIMIWHGVSADSSWVHSNADPAELRLTDATNSSDKALTWVLGS